MCKHFPEMAADPAKRARFVADCQRLMAVGFDGIDFDWEYPGPFAGMNFTGTQADFNNFTTLVQEVRQAIGAGKLITAAFSASPAKLQGFNWSALSSTMNYFNMMTYDFNGGWSTIAGHNAPLYDYPGAEASNWSWNGCYQALVSMGVPANKINMGSPFYGRGVVTNGTAALNAPTQKTQRTVDPDGPVSTAADFTNWAAFEGTPNYEYIRQNKSGWTEHWDDNAKVPYLTKGNYFLSYDNEQSTALKAQYVVDKGLAGVIVWTVFGDLEVGGSATSFGPKLVRYSSVKSPLVNKINEVFAQGNNGMPTVSITSPVNGATVTPGSSVVINATASDAGGSITKVEFLLDGVKVGEDTSSPYSFTITSIAAGSHTLSAKATDNSANTATASVTITASTNTPPVVSVTAPSNGATFTAGSSITITAQATDNGSVTKAEFYQGTVKLGEDATSPYSFTWTNVPAGSYSLTVVATDNENSTATSSAVTITVNGGNNCTAPAWSATAVYLKDAEVQHNGVKYRAKWWTQNENPETHSTESGVWQNLVPCGQTNVAPSVTLTAPTNGQTFTTGSSITLSAGASDTDGSVVNVEFYAGTTKLGEDATAPYSFTWNGAATGSHVLTAKAFDNSGASTVSQSVSITVTDGTNIPPVVSITSPANGASYTAPACITINATASDSDGAVVKVEFYQGITKLGEDTSSPYSFSWCNVAAGGYSITATATDNSGAVASTASVNITVTGADQCSGLPTYVENGGYVAGSTVKNAGSYYECREWPYSGWCNGAAWAYAPGTGTYWQDAWYLKGTCSASAMMVSRTDPEETTVQFYPNPFTDKLSVDIELEGDTEISVVLYDLTGTAVETVFQGRKGQGAHRFEMNGARLLPGLYTLKVEKAGASSYRRVVKR
jgi:chitinase